ncbi:DUF4064 domain-containing protein [Metabacillus sp. Hm71]|uniref:DUF4064 domain-containing protein n=1 Tax=Metabacillus sp. Hm71 TaxID=3450743 RepID=UPI003F42D8AE
MKRTTEFVLGLIGGIFGLIGAVMALFVGVVDEAFSGSTEISGLGWSAVLLSILGIVGSIVVKRKPKLGGTFMTIAAIGGVISVSMFYIIPGVLLIIGGLMGLIRKDKINSIEA